MASTTRGPYIDHWHPISSHGKFFQLLAKRLRCSFSGFRSWPFDLWSEWVWDLCGVRAIGDALSPQQIEYFPRWGDRGVKSGAAGNICIQGFQLGAAVNECALLVGKAHLTLVSHYLDSPWIIPCLQTNKTEKHCCDSRLLWTDFFSTRSYKAFFL